MRLAGGGGQPAAGTNIVPIILEKGLKMRPIFTVHAGEYLVGNEIERICKDYSVWIPSKDTGVDLLVTTVHQEKVASLQVKFSKDHLATGKVVQATPNIKCGGWWTFNLAKIKSSSADFWVLVLSEFATRRYDFLIIPPRELASRYEKFANNRTPMLQTYFWVTKRGKCFETRGLNSDNLYEICDGNYKNDDRDFSEYLNVWPFLADKAR